jgi:sugar/nucleoside kinase (ribokinase family)
MSESSRQRIASRAGGPSPQSPDFVTYCGLIVDDIVLPDGRTFFNTLGGGGTHAVAGMRVWADRLGYFAAIGSDFSPEHRAQLERLGIDLRGLIEREGAPTARAWQLFEPDERRIEVFRTSEDDFYRLEARFDELPADYLTARGYHLSHGTLADMAALVTRLRRVNPTACLVWEPSPLHSAGSGEAFRPVLAQVDAFSPDVSEARAITGQSELQAMIGTLLDWGARFVALRMGARGSLVATATGECHTIPAVPVTVVDTTGAGNAYAGGLLVALAHGDAAAEAGAKAAVSASFAIEQFGIRNFDERTRQIAEERLAWVRERIETGCIRA